MKWFCIGTKVLLFLILIKYWLYRRQIHEICRQLDFMQNETTNKRIQTDLSKKEIINLAEQINCMADRKEEESLSIKSKEQQLKETLANISHDIRTPLTSMKGFFELYTQEGELEKKEYYEQVIREKMDDLTVLLEELFTYTKLQNETYELHLMQQDFTKLVLDSLFSFYGQWKEKGISPVLSVDEDTIMVLCNDTAVRRIIANVLRNAMLHGDGNIEIRYQVKKGGVLFQCCNGFQNMEQPDMERVFERFYKGDSARRETSSGLGLSIAKELALRMDGSMEARTEDGRFLVELVFPRAGAGLFFVN